jgi:hypothetical protein
MAFLLYSEYFLAIPWLICDFAGKCFQCRVRACRGTGYTMFIHPTTKEFPHG